MGLRGLSQGTGTTGGLTQARQAAGHEPVREVFARSRGRCATEDTKGAVPGTSEEDENGRTGMGIPGHEANAAALDTRDGKDDATAAFPKRQASVTVGEVRTRIATELARDRPCCVSKGRETVPGAHSSTRSCGEKRLVLIGRPQLLISLYNWQDWCTRRGTGAGTGCGGGKSDLTPPARQFIGRPYGRAGIKPRRVRGKARAATPGSPRAGGT